LFSQSKLNCFIEPTYKDPFHTLAMIYESQGRVNKSVQFSLICGLLDPKHFDEWPRLAELSIEEGNTAQAIMCLNKGRLFSNKTQHYKREWKIWINVIQSI